MHEFGGSLRLAGPTRSIFHILSVTAVALACLVGCAQQTQLASSPDVSSPAPSPWAAPTATMRWNEYACELIARNQAAQFGAARTLAYVNLAINNAIVAARQRNMPPGGAAAGAASTVLMELFPKDQQATAARLAGELAALGEKSRATYAAAAEIGKAVGADVIASAKTDRTASAWTGTLPTGDGKWSSRSQPPQPPLGPLLGSARTFFLATGGDFRAPPPPAWGSPQFRAQIVEVRVVSDTRTDEQLRIAQYWENLTGSYGAGQWNDIARRAIAAHGLDEPQSARLLALVHMTAFDATLACHDSKYAYWVPRPTQADPEIRLAIGVPNHPSYPSNHSCISGSIGAVLDTQFPDERGRYAAMARQAGESRIYAGIHYRMDIDAGWTIAEKVSARALAAGIPTDRPFVPLGQ